MPLLLRSVEKRVIANFSETKLNFGRCRVARSAGGAWHGHARRHDIWVEWLLDRISNYTCGKIRRPGVRLL